MIFLAYLSALTPLLGSNQRYISIVSYLKDIYLISAGAIMPSLYFCRDLDEKKCQGLGQIESNTMETPKYINVCM